MHVSLQTTFHTYFLTLYVLLRMVVVWSKVVQWKPVSYEMKREYYHVLLLMFDVNCRITKYVPSIEISESLNNVAAFYFNVSKYSQPFSYVFLNIARMLVIGSVEGHFAGKHAPLCTELNVICGLCSSRSVCTSSQSGLRATLFANLLN